MKSSNVDDYLQKGMYGVKEIKPEERRKFLGTIRERIVVALTKSQVMEKGVYPEVIQLMKEHPKAVMLLNGDLDYSYLSDYIHKARSNHIQFSIVANKNYDTNIGLVLTYDYAIDKKEIYIQKNKEKTVTVSKKKKKSLTSLFRFLKK
ncbi:YueI family protein [Lederbergia panacisoli]|uniref:YueI family protein n=1 Tax=Lederbergia panacisoli TaxID=1255251 RepID=UPI00214C64D3|nr:YueI family protein [Lederbergia panacisoli]MCR2820321.1 YueI family protein [Lederbergia panacisoli]